MSAIGGNTNIIIEQPSEPQHLLSLKVMRQSNPLASKGAEKKSQVESLDSTDSKIPPSRIYMRDFNESELLSSTSITPNAIENIYLGATFDSYLFVTNDSILVARDVSIK